MRIRRFKASRLDIINFNNEMDCVLNDIVYYEEKGIVFDINAKNELMEVREEFFLKTLPSLQLHLVHAPYWKIYPMLPCIDMFMRTEVTGERIDRHYNNYSRIFFGKAFVSYFFKVVTVLKS